jgi:hypothetical protein
MKKILLSITLAFATFAGASFADDAAKRTFVDSIAKDLSTNPQIMAALQQSNAQNQNIDHATILERDTLWRDQVGAASKPDINQILNAPASDVLRATVAASSGKILEIILMDNHGLNAAISNITSDFWQGDEDKFLKTYALGAGAVDISAVEFDESANAYVVQISVVITDAGGMPIGAATLGLNADAF